jgi:hypothetical protein
LSGSVWNSFVREDCEVETDAIKDSLEHLDDLKRKVVLPDVIENFKNAWFEFWLLLLLLELCLLLLEPGNIIIIIIRL